MIVLSHITESCVPVAAAILVCLNDKYILNKARLAFGCQIEADEEDYESDLSNATDMTDALNTTSAVTTSTPMPPHGRCV